MLQSQSEEAQKLLQDFIKKKFPQLNNEEIEKISNQLLELGFFMVRLQLKKHSKTEKSEDEENFNQTTFHPP